MTAGSALHSLLNNVSSSDADLQRYSLQTLGNQSFLPRFRVTLTRVPGALEVLCQALESSNTHSVRYAAGCVRTLVTDAQVRKSLLRVDGLRRTLLSLSSHKNAKA